MAASLCFVSKNFGKKIEPARDVEAQRRKDAYAESLVENVLRGDRLDQEASPGEIRFDPLIAGWAGLGPLKIGDIDDAHLA